MTTFDHHTARHLMTDGEQDQELERRKQRLHELGLGDRPDPEFDAFAARLAEGAASLAQLGGTPYAMVNLITDHQYFTGLYAPPADWADPSLADQSGGKPEVSRIMDRDHGYCPHVVGRRTALVLPDVCAYPRFAGNPVVDQIGIRTYMGAPLIDPVTDVTLGTVCVVDTEPRPWGRQAQEGLEFIKTQARSLMEILEERSRGRAAS